MPTIHVKRDYFFDLLGKKLELKELEDICFDFGIEVEVDKEDESKLMFELAANRHELLCAEGLAEALAMYIGIREPSVYKLIKPETPEKMIVKPATQQIRPYVVSAILRNVTLNQDRYDSLIDLQDKLHMNLCRKRTLVAIGTHDYDTIKGPFTYDALPPEDIKFVPLNQTEAMDGKRLMEFYQNDLKLKAFLHIIRDSPVYPIITDSNGVVLSLPPIINGDHSKIKLTTKNIFIECTAIDYTKALVVLNILVTMFSRYCDKPFEVEVCENIYQHDGVTRVTPEFPNTQLEAEIDYIRNITGVDVDVEKAIALMKKMGLTGEKIDDKKIKVTVPVNRSDILHACDIAEDVAIAHGYNNIPDIMPTAPTTGQQLTLNKMTDLIRQEVAQAGYKECLNFALCSLDEISTFLCNNSHKELAVTIANPKTHDFQCGRTTLIPGLLKTLNSNKAQKLPIKLFEAGDVVLKHNNEVGARNERRLAALYTDTEGSGLEFIHGLLDYLMIKLNVPADATTGYSIQESKDPTFFPGRQAEVFLRGESIGIFGIVHPDVLKAFEITTPVSLIELNLEKLIFKGFFKE